MNILDNNLYKSDINRSLSNVIKFNTLKESKILVTGATGLVCSAVVDLLINSNLNITVYAAGRNEKKVLERFQNRVNFVYYDAIKDINFDVNVDYIIHGASNASPNLYLNEPVETMQANFVGMQNLLEFAREKRVKKILYVSSSEVYGQKNTMEPFREEQYGYVDILNPRSSYSMAKRATETLCVSFYKEYGIPFNIVRLGHIYGPTATLSDKRISSDFSFKAARGKNLVIKSDGSQIRSYCHCLDCATAILTVLTTGKVGEAYNISNSKSIISIREMATHLAAAGKVKLTFDIPNKSDLEAFNPMNNSSLDSKKLEKLGWNGIFTPCTGLTNTVLILRDILNNKLK